MIISHRTTQYECICDECGVADVVADSNVENVHSKKQAIKWAKLHLIKDGRTLCDKCFEEYKYSRSRKNGK